MRRIGNLDQLHRPKLTTNAEKSKLRKIIISHLIHAHQLFMRLFKRNFSHKILKVSLLRNQLEVISSRNANIYLLITKKYDNKTFYYYFKLFDFRTKYYLILASEKAIMAHADNCRF